MTRPCLKLMSMFTFSLTRQHTLILSILEIEAESLEPWFKASLGNHIAKWGKDRAYTLVTPGLQRKQQEGSNMRSTKNSGPTQAT